MKLLLLLWVLAAFGACTLLTSFNAEGQPCDVYAPPASQCLSGFHCGGDAGCLKGAYDAGP